MPSDHRRGLDDRQRVRPPRPDAGDDDPERTVDGPKPRSRSGATENRKLLAEKEVLGDEARPRPERSEQRAKCGLKDREHPREGRAGQSPSPLIAEFALSQKMTPAQYAPARCARS